MKDKLRLYEEISKSMIVGLKNEDYDLFDENLEKRQKIIDYLVEYGLKDEFKNLYNKNKIFELDRVIKELLDDKLKDTKRELREYRSKMQGNDAYSKIKKENLNIFYKKV